MTDMPITAAIHEPWEGRRPRSERGEHRRPHRGGRHRAARWSPTVLLARLALFALALGAAAWSVRWGWQTLQGS